MRFLLYNVRYGTGGQRCAFPWGGYFRRTTKNLGELTAFIKNVNPDIVGLVEVDAGSYRSCRKNQAQIIAGEMGHYHAYRSKYKQDGFAQRVPVLNKQGNAFLTRDSIDNIRFHYFARGFKRLVIELEMPDVVIFLVHLALSFRIRHGQLSDLYALVKKTHKPHIVAGDFNALWGTHEIELFLGATGLLSADPLRQPSFPSWAPKRQLDFILHSPDIQIREFHMPRITLSDHLPLVCDFEVCKVSPGMKLPVRVEGKRNER